MPRLFIDVEGRFAQYEMLFILNDDGCGITVFIPKKEGVSGDLLALCAQFSTPAQMTS